MKLIVNMIGLFLFCLVLAACGGTEDQVTPSSSAAPEGPALIMFYTDN